MIGVVDACFVIDWANYRRRGLLSEVFRLLYVHEEALEQVRSQRALEFLGEPLSSGVARLYPWSEVEED